MGLTISNFEFFTNRPNVVIGKLPGQMAEVEYVCDKCGFYEIKKIEIKKGAKKFLRPKFNCSKCGKVITVPALK